MRLGDILARDVSGATLAPDLLARDVTGVAADSRRVAPGSLFFAVPGTKADGLSFAGEAARRGAVAIVAERRPSQMPDVPLIEVADVRAELARAAARLYPRQPATIAAVTGTSGKTSVAAFLRQIWLACGHAAASLGTIGLVTPSGETYGSLTTPDPVTLHETLDRLAGEGVTHLAMEASSHGLDQRRLDAVRLSTAAFTNLSRDHLDYHADIEDYLAAKLRLFTTLLPQGHVAVIDADSDVADKVVAAVRAYGGVPFTIGRHGEAIRLEKATPQQFSTRLDLLLGDRRFFDRIAARGRFSGSPTHLSRRVSPSRPAAVLKRCLPHSNSSRARLAGSNVSARSTAQASSSIMRINRMRWRRRSRRCGPSRVEGCSSCLAAGATVIAASAR